MTEKQGRYRTTEDAVVDMIMKDTGIDTDKPPWEDSPGRTAVLGEMELTGEQGEVMMVSVRVEAFTVEAKVVPAQYEQSRVYAQFVPDNLYIHVPVINPGQHVDGAGNVSLFGYVARYIAREVERVGYRIASERADLRTVERDSKDSKKGGVKIGQSGKGEVL